MLAEGIELIIYAPHPGVVSYVHGSYIYEIAYHILPHFLGQCDRLKHVRLVVLAHNTHVKGDGRYHNGIEYRRATVKLATQLTPDDCERMADS